MRAEPRGTSHGRRAFGSDGPSVPGRPDAGVGERKNGESDNAVKDAEHRWRQEARGQHAMAEQAASECGEEDRQRAIARRPALNPSPTARYRPAGHRLERNGLVLVAPSGPGAPGAAIALGTPPSHAYIAALASEFFPTGTPYSVTLETGPGDVLEAALVEHGWRLDEEEPGLVLAPIPSPPAVPPGLAIRRVTEDADLSAFFSVLRRASAPGELTEPLPPHPQESLIPSLAAATDPDAALFVGHAEGEPVASSILYRYGDVAEIVGVTTLPRYRGRGFGTAMTWAAITEGAARGCSAATLTASAMGYPVYIRMGFTPVCVFRTYAPPAM